MSNLALKFEMIAKKTAKEFRGSLFAASFRNQNMNTWCKKESHYRNYKKTGQYSKIISTQITTIKAITKQMEFFYVVLVVHKNLHQTIVIHHNRVKT